MTVEPQRFNIKKSENCDNYIAYCGTMWGNKDGVQILIEAFSRISSDFPNIKLYLIGDTSNEGEFKKLKEKISLLKIEDKVVFTGIISSDNIPHLLVNAKMLVLARPDNIQAKGGFPTKLGEYLATGNPVVVTKVGEIPNYLIDGVNAFLAQPNSVDSFATKMKFVLNNIDLANNVGLKGKELTNTIFNYKVQSKKLIDFINSI
jgi:glycosyltransferase involved in cell wall biosynthesis